jgi:hypothetical protein
MSCNSHYKIVCRSCGKVIRQCACRDEDDKEIKLTTCSECVKKETEENEKANDRP